MSKAKDSRVKDWRTDKQQLFYPIPYSDGFVPKGANNEIFPMILFDKGAAKEVLAGEFQIGSDGFVEAMFFVEGKLVKLKKYPGDKDLYMSVFR